MRLKSSHRSTEHRAAMLFRRPAHRRTHAQRPLQVAAASKTSIVVTSDSMGSAAQPASPRRSGPHPRMTGAAKPPAIKERAAPGRQPRAKRLHRQPDAVTGLRLHPRAHKEVHSAKSRKTKRAFAARRCALPCGLMCRLMHGLNDRVAGGTEQRRPTDRVRREQA